jgi:hypothetical protein
LGLGGLDRITTHGGWRRDTKRGIWAEEIGLERKIRRRRRGLDERKDWIRRARRVIGPRREKEKVVG